MHKPDGLLGLLSFLVQYKNRERAHHLVTSLGWLHLRGQG